VQVQNKVQQATSRLPTEVQQRGVTVTKSAADFLMVVACMTRAAPFGGRRRLSGQPFQRPLGRVNGVGQTQVFGAQYAMRVWLDPAKLAAVKLMPSDVTSAITAQNVEVSAGQVGALPQVKGQRSTPWSRPSRACHARAVPQHRRQDADRRFGGAAERCGPVEMGPEDYSFTAQANGHPAAGLACSWPPAPTR
jgi:multidrug efflux pump